MKIAVIGAGAIGSVIAGYLTKAGQNCTLVGHDDQVQAIRNNGLHIVGARGEDHVKVNILSKLGQPHDLVIFATKTQDLERAYQDNHEFLEDCYVLTTQNGVQADNILSVHFEKEKMLSSIVMFGATYVKPGEVTLNFEGDWIIGRPFLPIGPKVHEINDVLSKSFSVVVSRDIMGMKWLKLFVNFNNCIPALIGKSMQETFADMDLCKLSIQLLKEGVEIVQKANIELVSLPQFSADKIFGLTQMPLDQAAGIMNQTLTQLSKEPLYGSILQSVLRKKTSEIDFINGEVVALAKQMRQEAPLNERIVDMVHHIERTGQFLSSIDVKKNLI